MERAEVDELGGTLEVTGGAVEVVDDVVVVEDVVERAEVDELGGTLEVTGGTVEVVDDVVVVEDVVFSGGVGKLVVEGGKIVGGPGGISEMKFNKINISLLFPCNISHTTFSTDYCTQHGTSS